MCGATWGIVPAWETPATSASATTAVATIIICIEPNGDLGFIRGEEDFSIVGVQKLLLKENRGDDCAVQPGRALRTFAASTAAAGAGAGGDACY